MVKINKTLADIEEVYGEDVADLVYNLTLAQNNLDGGYIDTAFSENFLYIYWGDMDVRNVYIIASDHTDNRVRVFSNEHEFYFEHLYTLIERAEELADDVSA